MKFYNSEACRRKANQHWELAGCARTDGDKVDADKHTLLAKRWDQRVREGGYFDGEEEPKSSPTE